MVAGAEVEPLVAVDGAGSSRRGAGAGNIGLLPARAAGAEGAVNCSLSSS